MIAATWRADKVPYAGTEIGYYLYEEVAHITRSQYQYWHSNGLAGCILKPHVRNRLGLSAESIVELLGNARKESENK